MHVDSVCIHDMLDGNTYMYGLPFMECLSACAYVGVHGDVHAKIHDTL